VNEAATSRHEGARALSVLEARDETNSTKRNWRRLFLDKLAETSNVTESAEAACVDPSRAYSLRRSDPDFAAGWRAALLEGYEHLEMETLYRLRNGTGKDDPKFDIANALRLLGIHRDTVAADRQTVDRDESSILASIDAKIEKMQAREKNVTRLLHQDGVRTPKLPGRND
jgi:hypothetical protein